ncbi:ferric reductase-like transmembrane domain-containing protein [Cytophagaceae bacterium ABcell3]|nr:ferric reductase-like transmembrane domain-containing protein [Cytophagaceae bacterium ABcell3]
MKYSYHRGIGWLIIYVIVALVPLAIALIGQFDITRGFGTELGTATGFLGLGLFALQFVISGRIKHVAPSYGMDNIIQYHREIGIIAFILILSHPIILFISDPSFLAFLDVSVDALRAISLIFLLMVLFTILATSLKRTLFNLSYEKWRLLHGICAVLILYGGLIHAFQVSWYTDPLWKKATLSVFVVVCSFALFYSRLIRPWKNKRKPYIIQKVIPERGQSTTITLLPENHEKMKYVAGQFAWLTVGETPFSLQQHPFSFTSSELSQEISFTAKEFGDFTSKWKHFKPGTKVFLEGPFGSFTPEPNHDIFMIMGGIGITPAMSMLRTFVDTKGKRKIKLIYGNQTIENITFREELEDLSKKLNLQVIHLLSEPPESWQGETGFVNQSLLKKHLPANPNQYMYFICGPDPLMDAAEYALRNLKIDWRNIYTERFQIV